jgi:Holliday junction DNA helicase RuvA
MYSYIKGKIEEIETNYIVVDNNGIGYQLYTANPYSFNIGDDVKVYLYQYIREDENTLYGFKTIEEKNLFLKLIGVKGLGCKMALPMFASGSIDGIKDAIERENILYLKKFPKIGDKVARQIILDLKGKLSPITNEINNVSNDELKEVLIGLGYKNNDIKKVLPNIDVNKSIEDQIKDALKLLLK